MGISNIIQGQAEAGLRETYLSYGNILRRFLVSGPPCDGGESTAGDSKDTRAVAVDVGLQVRLEPAHGGFLQQQRDSRALMTAAFALLVLAWLLQRLGIPLRNMQRLAP